MNGKISQQHTKQANFHFRLILDSYMRVEGEGAGCRGRGEKIGQAKGVRSCFIRPRFLVNTLIDSFFLKRDHLLTNSLLDGLVIENKIMKINAV